MVNEKENNIQKNNSDKSSLEPYTNKLRKGYVRIDGFFLPEAYLKHADAIENFSVRDDDVWVCSFPKTGTTWTQEMVWCINNNLNFEAAKISMWQRFPQMEFSILSDYSDILREHPDVKIQDAQINSIKFSDSLPSPRFLLSHLPFHLLPRALRERTTKAKIVYVTRNPKDTCISYFHYAQLVEGYTGDFEEFCKLFLADKLSYCPFWNHVLSYWKKKDDYENQMLLLTYESMKANLSSVIEKTSKFFGKSELSSENLKKLLDHLSFDKMKINSAVNYEDWIKAEREFLNMGTEGEFIRCGKVNQWKTIMRPEISEKFDERTAIAFNSMNLIS